jgi:hypothetical protein
MLSKSPLEVLTGLEENKKAAIYGQTWHRMVWINVVD